MPEIARQSKKGLILQVQVKPGSSRDQVVSDGEAVIVYTSAPADRGKANKAVLRLLADALDISTTAISLERGATSHTKTFVVAGQQHTVASLNLWALSLPRRV
jgi:uncharacterized protein (TIGR00251 family)